MAKTAESSTSSAPFQKCGSCSSTWNLWTDFILDPGIRLLGFQAISELPDANLIVFEHRCGSTISILAKRLRPLFPEIANATSISQVLYDSDACNHYCRHVENIEVCDRPCANARDRRMIHLLIKMKRGGM